MKFKRSINASTLYNRIQLSLLSIPLVKTCYVVLARMFLFHTKTLCKICQDILFICRCADGRCISVSLLCDYHDDCVKGEDENCCKLEYYMDNSSENERPHHGKTQLMVYTNRSG